MSPTMPDSLRVTQAGRVAVLTLDRPAKRNALDNATVRAIGEFFDAPPTWARAAVLTANGDHFSAGLDLNDLDDMDAVAGLHHSRSWHQAFDRLQSGSLPVVAALKGAVVGGGLELATAAHIRVAEDSTFFALPEGQRGLFVGGGASVRVPRLIGVHRMTDMMLTGRVLSADEGAAAGLVQYRVADGEGVAKAVELAERIAENSPISNYAVIHALPHIAEASHGGGLLLESLMSAVAQSGEDAKTRINDFLNKRGPKVTQRADP